MPAWPGEEPALVKEFSSNFHMAEGRRELCGVSFIKAWIPFLWVLASWFKGLPKTPHFLLHWGDRISTYESWADTNIQTIAGGFKASTEGHRNLTLLTNECPAPHYNLCLCAQLISHVWLFVTLGDCSPPGSSVHGISQAWILEWVVISYSRGSSWLRDRTLKSLASPALAGRFSDI